MKKKQTNESNTQGNTVATAVKGCWGLFLGKSADAYKTLRAWHVLIGSLFTVQAALLLAFANDFRVSLDLEYLSMNLATDQLETAARTVTELPLVWLAVALLLVGAAINFALASVWFERYKLTLSLNRNRFRWLNYSLSRGLLLVIIAVLFGVSNIALISLLFMTALSLGAFNVFVDSHYNRLSKRLRRFSYAVTWLMILMPWVVFILYAVANWLYDPSAVPTSVYVVTASALVYFLSYDFSFTKQRAGQGRWANYLYGEKVHLGLSFVFRSAIVWQIFVCTLT